MTRGSGEGVEYGDSNYYYIPETLLGTSGCAYKAIYNVFGSKYSLDSIQRAMKNLILILNIIVLNTLGVLYNS